MTYNEKLGEKIRLTREKNDMSVEQLAERAGVDVKMVESIEYGALVPYLSPLVKLSRALGVRLGTFLDDQEHLGPVVNRKDDQAHISRFRGADADEDEGRTFYSLALNKSSRHMEPLMVELSPSDEAVKKSSHEGEEFIYVLEGNIEVNYGKEVYKLSAGDSIYYDSIVEHDVMADGASARILAVIHEPA
ncbi:MAG: cupin domain-containing protein [Spirochaetales bacterium]|uniref:Cupin domain-containing protein n=1 Tax=Candidatus Thalassospirochaeta sargassi TaxID=3119039 RepID=A0AAJ1IDJ2_9SPIO|nr:cupin domain-containing protein [Spirochaetales bacterium]